MSDNIPFEIYVEIMKRLPVKSLIQFRSVSKAWKSMIDSSSFVADYIPQRTQLLVRYTDVTDCKTIYVSVVDDDTFPTTRLSLTPPRLQMHGYYRVMGYSHGLFCLYQIGPEYPVSGTGKAALWNPTIRKTVEVDVPNVATGETYETVLGFWVCHENNEPKIVKITHFVGSGNMESASYIPWQVDIFTLSTKAWRSLGGDVPCKFVRFHFSSIDSCCSVVINGVIYWFATDMVTSCNLIVSFDITSEEFGEVNLPNRLAYPQRGHYCSMFKLRESLVVLDEVQEADRLVYDVWLMESGVPESFTKLSNCNLNKQDSARALGFRNSGEHIIEIVDFHVGHVVAYEPHSKHIDNLGIDGMFNEFFVHPYMETLCLFDQPNRIVDD